MPLEVDAEGRDHQCPALHDRCLREFSWSTALARDGAPRTRPRTVWGLAATKRVP